jgi:SAM-dependent methyltransferase
VAKQHEVEYPVRIGEALTHAAGKPFSDPLCGQYLVRIGTLMSLLPPAPARVLDLGCGTGWTSRFFARAGYEVVGADIAPEMIRVANECRDAERLHGLSFVVSDYETLAFREEFDAAVFFDSLHHADDEALAIRKAFAALKPGGVLLTDEPGVGHSTSADSLAAMAKYGVTEKDMPPAKIVALGQAAGFDTFRVFPSPEALGSAVYTRRADPLPDPFADTDPAVERLHTTGLRRVYNRAVSRLGSTPPWRLTNVDHLLLNVRENGLVLMRKRAQSARAAA